MPELYSAQQPSNLELVLARMMQRPRRVDDAVAQTPNNLPVPRAPNPPGSGAPPTGNFPGGPGLTPTNPNAPWGGDAPVPDTTPGHGLAATISAIHSRTPPTFDKTIPLPAGTSAAPAPTRIDPVLQTPIPAGTPESGRLAALLSAQRAVDPSQKVSLGADSIGTGPPIAPTRKHEALMGALQGALIAGQNGPTQGTGLRMLGGAATGAASGAISPRLVQALERHQEEQRTQAKLDAAQQAELRTAQIRDTTAQAAQREADAVKVDYTPPGAIYPVKVDPKDYALLTQRDAKNAQDPWTTYTPPGSRTPLKVRSSEAARLEATHADSAARLAQQSERDATIDRRLSEQERHNREMEKLGRAKEAKTAQTNINKLKQAKSKVEAYSAQRDALDADAEKLERAAAAEDAKTDKWGDQDPVAKTKAADLRRQADEKRRASQRAHDQIIQAQSVVDAIPEVDSAPAARGSWNQSAFESAFRAKYKRAPTAAETEAYKAAATK